MGTKFCDEDGSKLVTPNELIPKCVKCGKEYPDGTKFCSECGRQITSETSRNDRNDDKNIDVTDGLKIKKSTIFSLGLIVAFFLPWFNFVFFSLSGFKIPIAYDSIVNFAGLFEKNMAYMKVTYLLYLLPCCATYNILVDLFKGKKYFLNEFTIGLIFSVLLLIIVISNGSSLAFFGIGYYLTAIFSVLGLSFNDRKEIRKSSKIKKEFKSKKFSFCYPGNGIVTERGNHNFFRIGMEQLIYRRIMANAFAQLEFDSYFIDIYSYYGNPQEIIEYKIGEIRSPFFPRKGYKKIENTIIWSNATFNDLPSISAKYTGKDWDNNLISFIMDGNTILISTKRYVSKLASEEENIRIQEELYAAFKLIEESFVVNN